MSLAAIQREAVKKAIEMNPTTVQLKRKEWKPKGSGRELEESTVGSYTILIASSTRRVDDVNTGGRKAVTDWVALTESNVDVKWGSNIEDWFEVIGIGKFKVAHARPVSISGQVSGYELQLELIM